MEKRIVITGIGVLTGNGKGKEEYWQSLYDGKVGYKPITLFNTDDYRVNMAGEISDFDAKEYMGAKGLRSLDRATKLLVSASKLAVADSQFEITDDNTDDVGVSVGTTFGSLQSISDFDMTTLREGPRYTNPAHFPNTVMNSPASQVSIWNNIQGFNSTISTGFTASLDAMSYACDFINLEHVKIVYAGSIEELCMPVYAGFYSIKFLSGSKAGESFINCPFDKRRNGITFGEAACLIAMEELEHAKKRKANILGEVLGFGYAFDSFRMNKYNPRGDGFKEAMRDVLKESKLDPEDVDCIFAGANSTQAADKIESDAIKEVFGKKSSQIPVTAIKSMTGECYSSSGSLMVIAALASLNRNFIPPTVNYEQKDPDCNLDYVPNKARKAKLNKILINNFSPTGANHCMILGRYE